MHRLRRLGSVVIGSGLLTVAACGGSEETFESEAGDVTVSRDGETVTFRSEEGEVRGSFGAGATLPEGFPEDAPIPSSGSVAGTVETPDGTMVTLEFTDSVEEAGVALEQSLRENGWSLDEDNRLMGQRILTGSKGDRFVSVQIMEVEGTVRAMVMLGDDAG